MTEEYIWLPAEEGPLGEHWRLVCDPPDLDERDWVEVRTVKMTSRSDSAQEIKVAESIALGIQELEFLLPILTRELERMRRIKSKRNKATEAPRAPDLKTAGKVVDLFEALKESLKQ